MSDHSLTVRSRVVGRMVSNARRTMAQAMKHIKPLIDERRAQLKAMGEDWSDKPVRPILNVSAIYLRLRLS